MTNAIVPTLELCVVVPGLLLAYLPMKSRLKQPLHTLALWEVPFLILLSIAGGKVCFENNIATLPALGLMVLVAAALYIRTVDISLWKSGSVALSVCAVFACINSVSRAVNAAMLEGSPHTQTSPWLCLPAVACYNVLCWLFVAASCYPATHVVREMVEDDNFAQTWYVFWILPLVFIALNLFMVPKHSETLYTGRVLQGYFVLSIALLVLFLWFSAGFLLMATSLNRNARLRQENQILSMQQHRYDNLKASIEETRQARHDMRHHLNQLSILAEKGDIDRLKEYIAGAVSRIPNLDMHLCENRAVDSVVGYYCEAARRNGIPFSAHLALPEELPIDEMDMCLVLSNLLENSLEASMRAEPSLRRISVTSYLHAGSLLLIQVENAYTGKIKEKDGVFLSSKRNEFGIGIRSVRHIAEKSGGACSFTYDDGVFCVKVMLRGR